MDGTLMTSAVAILFLLLYVAAIISALEAIIKARTSQGAIAWTISLVTLPYVSLPLYLIFGRNRFDGYLDQRDEIEQESLALIQQTSGLIESHIVPVADDAPLYASLFVLARMPATTGNHVELLVNGQQTFDSLIAGLAEAEQFILFQFYIIREDDLGHRLCRILSDKAESGVDVFLLYDEIGSRSLANTAMYKQLQASGVKVAPFNTTQGRRNRFQLNFRNHRKNVVVDGKYAWIGGHNVGDEYLGLDRRIGHWRDTHTRVEGPAVLGAVLAFATDWRWAMRSPMNIDWKFHPPKKGDSTVLVFPSDPASEFEEAGLMYHQAIVAANKRIWIASPYFVPDHGIVSALQLAALRGVDVRVLIPDEPDGPVVAMANWAHTKDLLPAGVKVYRYQGGFMHQKVLLMDDSVSGVGTANFDNRSFRLNFELTLLVHDKVFAAEVDEMLQADFRRSRQVSLEEIESKPVWFPMAMAVAKLFSPVL